MTSVATTRTRSIFLNVAFVLWVVLVCFVKSALACSFICYPVYMVRISLFLLFCYILYWIISFILRSSFLLWPIDLQLDSWIRPEKEWFPRRTRDAEESAVPCNTPCHGSYLQNPGMNDILLVSGRKPTIKKYAVPGSPLRRSDELPSWLIMRSSPSWRLARISS
jgi:hypothetical protein